MLRSGCRYGLYYHLRGDCGKYAGTDEVVHELLIVSCLPQYTVYSPTTQINLMSQQNIYTT